MSPAVATTAVFTKRALLAAVGLALGALCLAGPAAAAAASEPDITGMWDFQGRVQGAQPRREPPPLIPALAAKAAEERAARNKVESVRNVGNMLCLPTGFPQLMSWKSPIEILQTRGRVTVISEHDPGNDEPRTIYMDRPMPKDVDLTWNGYSVGKWEGQTLVIETTGLNDRADAFGVPRTPTTRIVERMHLENGGKTLLDDLTITDPATLTKPFTRTLTYTRMPEDTERFEAVCETDFEALHQTDLKAYAAFDKEAARMIDPKQTYNPGGR